MGAAAATSGLLCPTDLCSHPPDYRFATAGKLAGHLRNLGEISAADAQLVAGTGLAVCQTCGYVYTVRGLAQHAPVCSKRSQNANFLSKRGNGDSPGPPKATEISPASSVALLDPPSQPSTPWLDNRENKCQISAFYQPAAHGSPLHNGGSGSPSPQPFPKSPTTPSPSKIPEQHPLHPLSLFSPVSPPAAQPTSPVAPWTAARPPSNAPTWRPSNTASEPSHCGSSAKAVTRRPTLSLGPDAVSTPAGQTTPRKREAEGPSGPVQGARAGAGESRTANSAATPQSPGAVLRPAFRLRASATPFTPPAALLLRLLQPTIASTSANDLHDPSDSQREAGGSTVTHKHHPPSPTHSPCQPSQPAGPPASPLLDQRGPEFYKTDNSSGGDDGNNTDGTISADSAHQRARRGDSERLADGKRDFGYEDNQWHDNTDDGDDFNSTTPATTALHRQLAEAMLLQTAARERFFRMALQVQQRSASSDGAQHTEPAGAAAAAPLAAANAVADSAVAAGGGAQRAGDGGPPVPPPPPPPPPPAGEEKKDPPNQVDCQICFDELLPADVAFTNCGSSSGNVPHQAHRQCLQSQLDNHLGNVCPFHATPFNILNGAHVEDQAQRVSSYYEDGLSADALNLPRAPIPLPPPEFRSVGALLPPSPPRHLAPPPAPPAQALPAASAPAASGGRLRDGGAGLPPAAMAAAIVSDAAAPGGSGLLGLLAAAAAAALSQASLAAPAASFSSLSPAASLRPAPAASASNSSPARSHPAAPASSLMRLPPPAPIPLRPPAAPGAQRAAQLVIIAPQPRAVDAPDGQQLSVSAAADRAVSLRVSAAEGKDKDGGREGKRAGGGAEEKEASNGNKRNSRSSQRRGDPPAPPPGPPGPPPPPPPPPPLPPLPAYDEDNLGPAAEERIARALGIRTPEEMATHGPTFAYISRSARVPFLKGCEQIMDRAQTCHQKADKDGECRAWAHLLEYVQRCMTVPRGHEPKGKNGGIPELAKAFLKWSMDGDMTVPPPASDGGPDAAPGKEAPPDPVARAVARAQALTRSGFVSRAASALTQTGIADPHEEDVVKKLRELHPRGPKPKDLPRAPSEGDEEAKVMVTVDNNFKMLCRRVNNGSAPGPSGWRGSVVATLVKSRGCTEGLAFLVERLINGDLDPRLRPYFLGARLIGIPKPDNGVRPVAIGEVFYKLAAMYACLDLKNPLNLMLAAVGQYGESPGGCEKVAVTIQALTTSSKTPTAVLSFDARNCFNEMDRKNIMQEVFKHDELSDIWPLVGWAYGVPSPLWVQDPSDGSLVERLNSEQGVRQGDVLGSKLICVALRPVLEELNKKFPNVRVLSIIDDVNLGGSPSEVVQAGLLFVELASKIGYTVRFGKCKMLWFHDTPLPADATDQLRNWGVPVVRDATIILGVPVGRDQDKMRKLVTAIVDESTEFFGRLLHHRLGVQEAMLLLRMSGNARLGYAQRTTSSNIHGPAAKAFAETIRGTLARLLKLKTADVAGTIRARAEQPIRNGGLGLTDAESVSSIAFLAGVAQAAGMIAASLPDGVLAPDSQLQKDIELALPTVRAAAGPKCEKLLPPHGKDFIAFYSGVKAVSSDKLQKALTAGMQDLQREALVAKLDEEQKATLDSCTGRWAGTLVTTIPSERAFQLSSEASRQAFRLRLGASPVNDLPARCVCAEHPRFASQHALDCKLVKPLAITHGHDGAVQAIAQYVRRAGGACMVEPRIEWGTSRKRGDFRAIMGTDVVIGDFSVINAAAKSYRKKGKGEAAKERERAKEKKYRKIVEEQGGSFTPFVVEAFGAFSEGARDFVLKVARFAETAGTGWSRHDIIHGMVTSVTMAVHRRNAAAVLQLTQMVGRRSAE